MAREPDMVTVMCPDCDGLGYFLIDCCGEPYSCQDYIDCTRCMGAGVLEVQRGRRVADCP